MYESFLPVAQQHLAELRQDRMPSRRPRSKRIRAFRTPAQRPSLDCA